ncbi:MAG: dihydrofolate reductase [Flavobacteriaceae bacterium]|nr:dihydrofolate reductase [Flavobacteriaceae bacterium]
MLLSLIVVADLNNAIGLGNQLLCHFPADLKYFKALTTGHCILMGRKTYESIGRPLPNRTNIIVTRNAAFVAAGCIVTNSLEAGIAEAEKLNETELFTIGGAELYRQVIGHANRIYLTRINNKFADADTFFSAMDSTWKLTASDLHQADEKNAFDYTFEVWDLYSPQDKEGLG